MGGLSEVLGPPPVIPKLSQLLTLVSITQAVDEDNLQSPCRFQPCQIDPIDPIDPTHHANSTSHMYCLKVT